VEVGGRGRARVQVRRCSVDLLLAASGHVCERGVDAMFVRANRRRKDGRDHVYWSLVETVRTPDGPRQHTICYLGELNSAAEARWRKTVRIFNAEGEAQQLALLPAGAAPGAGDTPVVEIRLDRVRWTRPRGFGDVWLGWHLWQRLGLDRFCETALDEVPSLDPRGGESSRSGHRDGSSARGFRSVDAG